MTQKEADLLKEKIRAGYHDRKDYPPFALLSWDDRNRYLEYIGRVIDDFVKEKA